MATALTNGVDATTYRIPTDGRTVADVTSAVIPCTGWLHG
jgi:hypothetical protein